MKFLFIPIDFHIQGVLAGVEDAFKSIGHEAVVYSTFDDAVGFSPDAIVYQGSLEPNICAKLKKSTGATFVMITGDFRYTPTPSLMELRGITDLYLLPFTGEYRRLYEHILGVRCEYLFEYIHPHRYMQPYDREYGAIVFVGNSYTHFPSNRQQIMEFLSIHIQGFFCYGSLGAISNGVVQNNLVPILYNKSYAVVCENNWHDVEGYFTPRNVGAMAAGSCALMKHFPGIESHFYSWENCIVYKHQYELIDICNFLINHPDIRNKIANKGYQHSLNFGPSKWAERLVSLI